MTVCRSAAARGVATAALLLAGAALHAQAGVLAPQRTGPPSRWRPALRADLIADRDVGVQFAAGAATASAYNVRVGLDVGAGFVARPGGSVAAGRIDLLGRWLADPFRQSRWGISGGGGLGLRVEAGAAPRPVAILTLGVEGPSDGTWLRGVELGLGGGVRLGATLRRAPLRRR